MEERVPPIIDKNHDHECHDHDEEHEYDSLPVTDPVLRSGTYVVQVPKDQVYRVPPPENAVIAERHRNPKIHKRSCSCCLCVLIIIIALVVVVGLIVGVSYIVLKPNDPNFNIEHVVVKNPASNNSHPDYTITLKAENPNGISSISYEKGGDASLSFKEHKLATGNYPTFNQAYKNSKVFDIVLHGSKTALPKEIDESLKSKKSNVHISLSLSMNNVQIKFVIAEMTIATKKIDVSCNLTVDSLAKETRVLSQECNTKS